MLEEFTDASLSLNWENALQLPFSESPLSLTLLHEHCQKKQKISLDTVAEFVTTVVNSDMDNDKEEQEFGLNVVHSVEVVADTSNDKIDSPPGVKAGLVPSIRSALINDDDEITQPI